MNPYNQMYHFIHNGKQYYRQVEHKGREAEVKFRNRNGDYIIAYRDKPEDWVIVKFELLETVEFKKYNSKNIAA